MQLYPAFSRLRPRPDNTDNYISARRQLTDGDSSRLLLDDWTLASAAVKGGFILLSNIAVALVRLGDRGRSHMETQEATREPVRRRRYRAPVGPANDGLARSRLSVKDQVCSR